MWRNISAQAVDILLNTIRKELRGGGSNYNFKTQRK